MKQIIKGVVFVGLLLFMIGKTDSWRTYATEYSITIPRQADKGSIISGEIEIKDNPGLTSLGLRLVYDANILEYRNVKWKPLFSDDDNQIKLVSDVEYAGKRAVNISFIDRNVFCEEGTVITVYFNVVKSYNENPIELEFRDATDAKEIMLPTENQNVVVKSSGKIGKRRFEIIVWVAIILCGSMIVICMMVRCRLKANARREIQRIIGYQEN